MIPANHLAFHTAGAVPERLREHLQELRAAGAVFLLRMNTQEITAGKANEHSQAGIIYSSELR
jgi:hypothetical protein